MTDKNGPADVSRGKGVEVTRRIFLPGLAAIGAVSAIGPLIDGLASALSANEGIKEDRDLRGIITDFIKGLTDEDAVKFRSLSKDQETIDAVQLAFRRQLAKMQDADSKLEIPVYRGSHVLMLQDEDAFVKGFMQEFEFTVPSGSINDETMKAAEEFVRKLCRATAIH